MTCKPYNERLRPFIGPGASFFYFEVSFFHIASVFRLNLSPPGVMLYMYNKDGGDIMVAVRLPQEMEDRLAILAEKTGRSKSFYIRQALEEQDGIRTVRRVGAAGDVVEAVLRHRLVQIADGGHDLHADEAVGRNAGLDGERDSP